MTARYYVQDGEVWMKDAPGAPADWDAPVFHERRGYAETHLRDRDATFRVDVIAALRAAGMCEPQDRVAE